MEPGLINGLLATLATIVAASIAALGPRVKTKSDSLDRAATWWEKSVERLEAKISEQDSRLSALEKDNATLQAENRSFRHAIREVVSWVTLNLEHERAGKPPPLPYPFERLLTRLMAVIDKSEMEQNND